MRPVQGLKTETKQEDKGEPETKKRRARICKTNAPGIPTMVAAGGQTACWRDQDHKTEHRSPPEHPGPQKEVSTEISNLHRTGLKEPGCREQRGEAATPTQAEKLEQRWENHTREQREARTRTK